MAINPFSLAVAAVMTGVNLLVNAMRTIEGPRLNDTSPVVADYGTPLNYFIGRRLLACPAFFAKPIREVRQEHKGKGGKQVQYTGFATWASHICDHEIIAVRKIWFDSHLVYDATGEEPETYPLGDDYDLEASLRIYYGTEDQEADPDMLAYIEARDGAGTCPAYRPTAYVYFQYVPVEKIGNRFPTVTMLVDSAIGLPAATGSVIIDFQNETYSINGASKSLTEVATDTGGFPFPTGGLVMGEGWRAEGDPMDQIQESIFTLTSEALAAVIAGGLPITVTMAFNLQLEGAGEAVVDFSINDADSDNVWSFDPTLHETPAPPAIEIDHPGGTDTDAMASNMVDGDYTATVILSAAQFNASIPSLGSASLADPPTFTPAGMVFRIGAFCEFTDPVSAQATLRSITITQGAA